MTQSQFIRVLQLLQVSSSQSRTAINKKIQGKLSKTNFSPRQAPMKEGTDSI